jgi:hypothetical protein
MLRTERPRLPSEPNDPDRAQLNSRELLLAVAPPPLAQSSALAGWPTWLIPKYRSGGHRPEIRLFEAEEER